MFVIDFGYPLGKWKLIRTPASCGDEDHAGHPFCQPGWEERLPEGSKTLMVVLQEGWVAYSLVPASASEEADVHLPVEDPVRVRLGLFREPRPVPKEDARDVERLLEALRKAGIFTTPETCYEAYSSFSEEEYLASWLGLSPEHEQHFVEFVASFL